MKRSWSFLPLVLCSLILGGCGNADSPKKTNQATASPKSNDQAQNDTTDSINTSDLDSQTHQPTEIVVTLADPGFLLPSANPWKIKQGKSLKVDRNGLLQAVESGVTQLESNDAQGRLIVQSVKVLEPESIDFANDILPILTRHGCNSGGCHGRLDGQNGFKLSLFGYAPEQDFKAIVKDSAARRIDMIDASSSLILRKASGLVPHGGGQVMDPSSADFTRIKSWLSAGASEHAPKKRLMKSLRITPESIQAGQAGEYQVKAIAKFNDDSERDVSAWSTWKILDDKVARVDPFGRLTVLESGETDIVVRYGSQVKTARVSLPGPLVDASAFETLKSDSYIDKTVSRHLQGLNIPPSPLTSDAAFLRRVTLDLVGRLPEPVETRRFLKDSSPDKRQRVIAELFKDADFTKFWSLKFGDFLQISSARQGNSAPFYLLWLQDQLEKQAPWDKMVRDLLTTRGDPSSKESAAAAYSLENIDPITASQLTAQRLLGIRLRCAQCHDHPFDVWTQTQSHQFAAFFAKVRPIAPMPGQMMGRTRIGYFPEGKVLHPRTLEPVPPIVLSGNQPIVKSDTDPLPALADWATSAENPFMAKAFVNWLWAQFFATGLVDPVDDLSAANPPTHPELLDALARRFIELKYQMRPMITEILESRVYQASSLPNAQNSRFARLNAFQSPRTLSAQQLADALAQATGIPNRYTNKPTGTRAVEIQDPSTASAMLDTLGRCGRLEACASSAGGRATTSLRQSLLWISSDTVDGKVGAVSGYVRQMMDLEPEPEEIVENLFLRTVCRFPTDSESKHWKEVISTSKNRPEIVEDLFWALLNTREFLFNH